MSIRQMSAVWDLDELEDMVPTFVLLSLADQANDAGECFPSISLTARRCRMSERSVHNALRKLETAGWVKCTRRPGKRTLYTLCVPCMPCRGERGAGANKVHGSAQTPAAGRTTPAPRAPVQEVQTTTPARRAQTPAPGAATPAPRAVPIRATITNRQEPRADVAEGGDKPDLDAAPWDGREFELLDEAQQDALRPALPTLQPAFGVRLALLADVLVTARRNGHGRDPNFAVRLVAQIAAHCADGGDANEALAQTLDIGECDRLIVDAQPAPAAPPAAATEAASAPAAKRGARLPEDWQPSLADFEWAAAECPNVNAKAATAMFKNYWGAASGQSSRKSDWTKAWKFWLQRDQFNNLKRGPNGAHHESASERVARKNRERAGAAGGREINGEYTVG